MNDGVKSDDAALAGALLADRYRVIEPIGSGGMARVFLARDEALGRPVAVKVLRSELTDTASADRAAIETRLLASLNHPGLVTLFDAHLNEEPRFLVMEHVVGMTLSERIASQVLDARELAALGGQLADALHIVHDAGIVHRDVKPSNILLARSTVPGVPLRAKLADFGIAHLLDSERVTSPSLLIGTAAYIAPELLHGADPAPPSDIYALGLVLLEAASGERAFAGSEGNRGQLLARLTRDPDMPTLLGHEWRDLLYAMTARQPEDRPTAAEVMSRLSGHGVTPGGAMVPLTTGAGSVGGIDLDREQSDRRAAMASVATAAWPITPARGTEAPRYDAPVTAASAFSSRADGEPTLVTPSLAAAAASAPDRVIAERRRRRKRSAIALGAVAASALGVVISAHLMFSPQTAPTTDVTDRAVVQTPPSIPAEEGPADDSGDESGVADDAVTDTQTVVAPETGGADASTDIVGTAPADTTTVDSAVPPAENRGSGPGANSGNGAVNGNGSGNGNGNGPGANSGSGPGSAPGSAPGKPDKPGG